MGNATHFFMNAKKPSVIQIHKFFWPKGGADIHYLELIDLLCNKGHTVIPFSMQASSTEISHMQQSIQLLYKEYNTHFVPRVDFQNFHEQMSETLKRFWYTEAQKRLNKLIAAKSSELDSDRRIAHIHNIYHQISPSILPLLREHNIPIVMTVHDLALVATNLAEGMLERVIFGFELITQQHVYKQYIDRFIVPSRFVKDKLIEAGFSQEKIRHIPHFTEQTGVHKITKASSKQRYIVYFGRLSYEKGVDTLIKGFIKSQYEGDLLIIGDGPMRKKLESQAQSSRRSEQIKFLGHLSKTALYKHVDHAELCVIPSRIPETFGLSAIEALVRGVPVVTGNYGAVPELIHNNKNGLILGSIAASSLADVFNHAWNSPAWVRDLGIIAKKSTFTGKHEYYERLIDVYKELL